MFWSLQGRTRSRWKRCQSTWRDPLDVEMTGKWQIGGGRKRQAVAIWCFQVGGMQMICTENPLMESHYYHNIPHLKCSSLHSHLNNSTKFQFHLNRFSSSASDLRCRWMSQQFPGEEEQQQPLSLLLLHNRNETGGGLHLHLIPLKRPASSDTQITH